MRAYPNTGAQTAPSNTSKHSRLLHRSTEARPQGAPFWWSATKTPAWMKRQAARAAGKRAKAARKVNRTR